MLNEKYESEVEGFKMKRLYIDEIKQDLGEFLKIKMFGASLELCGFKLKVGKFEFVNACACEYHLRMFNKKRYNGWTTQRLLKELNINTIDEGITLNQLIPLYQKYKIGFHVVDYKYHTTVSYHEYQQEIMLLYFT
jgi:hypothetical protein